MLLAAGSQTEDVVVPVFDDAAVQWDRSIADGTEHEGVKRYREGQIIERTVNLPPMPANQRDARRIVAKLILEPEIIEEDGKLRPGDPWTRFGSVTVVRPAAKPASTPSSASAPADDAPSAEVEIMRFITSFGGPGTYTQDVTALAPLLQGQTTVRLHISTYKKPAWKATLTFNYSAESAGYRRPVWAQQVFLENLVTAEKNKVTATIEVPGGLARPRLLLTCTGHATDGTGGDEFVSRTHVLRIDGLEVARWRPWNESGAGSHTVNPMSGRIKLDGRELWSCDLDRSGWRPGEVVPPMALPVPELTPGRHKIELEVVNIRPKDQLGNHGYWRESCIVVADEPWPNDPEPPR